MGESPARQEKIGPIVPGHFPVLAPIPGLVLGILFYFILIDLFLVHGFKVVCRLLLAHITESPTNPPLITTKVQKHAARNGRPPPHAQSPVDIAAAKSTR